MDDDEIIKGIFPDAKENEHGRDYKPPMCTWTELRKMLNEARADERDRIRKLLIGERFEVLSTSMNTDAHGRAPLEEIIEVMLAYQHSIPKQVAERAEQERAKLRVMIEDLFPPSEGFGDDCEITCKDYTMLRKKLLSQLAATNKEVIP